MDLGLKDKIAVVTGAGGGIGSSISIGLMEEGCKTIMVDIGPKQNNLKKVLSKTGGKGDIQICDVTSYKEVKSLFKKIEKSYGFIHILVNCAATSKAGYIEDIDKDDIDSIINLNIKGYIYTTINAIPLMKKAGYGRLIYINSNSGLKASAGLSLYSGSKYFNRGFAISAALELGKFGITSNSVCPSDIYPEGEIEAGSWKEPSLLEITMKKEGVSSLEEIIEKRKEKNPMKRTCTAEDVKNVVLFLASERAGFINAQSIAVNGGSIPY